MNRTIVVEFVLAVLTTQMDAMRRVLDTADLTLTQFGWALLPPLVLFGLWELGKLDRPPDDRLGGPVVVPVGCGLSGCGPSRSRPASHACMPASAPA